jgi:hypothetical protein
MVDELMEKKRVAHGVRETVEQHQGNKHHPDDP